VDEKVIVELKVAKEYHPKDEPQLLDELKATTIKVGESSISEKRKQNSSVSFINRINVSSVFTPVDRNL